MQNKADKTAKSDSFFHSRLQAFVANALFPSGQGDWYKSKGYGKDPKGGEYAAFDDFLAQQKNDETAIYHKAFKGLDFELDMVKSQLTNEKECQLEVLKCAPLKIATQKPGTGKHIVYFPGANTYYQACFRDITAAANQTGATVHAFNFPGTGKSTGKVREANDCINAGIAVVHSLLRQGVKPDDIILQGDCYGAAIALEVKKQFEEQANTQIRIIMNNSFKSFKAAVCDMITDSPWLPNLLKSIVKRLLEYTGWHITPGKKYVHADPYQCHIQHISDQTLISSSLSKKVDKYQEEIKTETTSSQKRKPKIDNCPEDYKEDRKALDGKHMVKVKASAEKRLGNKFGRDKFGNINAHFADLCELELLNGDSVYEGYVNDYIERSDKYIAKHPQEKNPKDIKVCFLAAANSPELTLDEAEEIQSVIEFIHPREFNLDSDVDDMDIDWDNPQEVDTIWMKF
ncbi:Dot/Icm T4SS effector alpha/beta hydrolase [uncultured Legionella sp.]|uniref:Dot/Icm T4SS effector alpha/beta hydrolase n=1 Tax=uncultured Legionella sp. TaxID=210934 RepID=UPI00260BD365|nr:Dot/Icm T4SS effector alpha/beta hydrolase [uncultured Legionella sp.]